MRDGQASGLTCPDCFSSIWELAEGHLVSFDSPVQHRYSPESFLGAQAARVEEALWTEINVLEERGATLRWSAATRFAQHEQLAPDYETRAGSSRPFSPQLARRRMSGGLLGHAQSPLMLQR